MASNYAEWSLLLCLWTIYFLPTSTGMRTYDLSRCPPNILAEKSIFTAIGEKCYQFIRTEMYWDDARNYCRRRSGDLITINSRQIQGMVENTMHFKWTKNGMWIGANDKRDEGHWTWVTGEAIGYNNWDSNQPSCFLPKFMCVEDCAVVRKDESYKWHDYHCRASPYKYGFACQYNKLRRTTTSTTLPTTPTSTTKATTTTPTASTTRKTTSVKPTRPPFVKTTISTILPPEKKSTPTVTMTTKSSTQATNASIIVQSLIPNNLVNVESQRLSSKESGLQTGGVVGLVMSFFIVFLAGLILGVVVCRRRYRRKYSEDVSSGFNNVLYTAAPQQPAVDRVKQTNVMIAATAGDEDGDDNGYSSIEEVQACAKNVNLPTAKELEACRANGHLYETVPSHPQEVGGATGDDPPPPYPGCNFTGFQPEFLKKDTDVSEAYSNNLYGYHG